MAYRSTATYQVIWPDLNNTVYDINGSNGFSHISLDGAGIPEPIRSYSPFALSDGGIDDGFTLDARRMVWKIYINGSSEFLFDTLRASFFSVFRPLQDPYRLRVTRADGAVRQINCYVEGAIEIEPDDGYAAIATVPLIAPDPLWYDPVQQVVTFATWPATTITVPYDGTWYEWPVVKVTGRVDNFSLTNVASAADGASRIGKIDLRPNGVPNGSNYTFDTRPTKKTAVNQSGANVLGTAFGTGFQYYPEFRLWPKPIKTGGSNVMDVTHGTTNLNAAIEFRYYNRYIGL